MSFDQFIYCIGRLMVKFRGASGFSRPWDQPCFETLFQFFWGGSRHHEAITCGKAADSLLIFIQMHRKRQADLLPLPTSSLQA